MKTELETRPYLVVWNDHTRDMLVRASQIERPDADETCFVFWRGCDEVLIAPIDNVHHVRPLTDVQAKAHAEETAACAEAHVTLHELARVLRGQQKQQQHTDDLLHDAWMVISSASGWDRASVGGWRESAEKWRDRFHTHIGVNQSDDGGQVSTTEDAPEVKPAKPVDADLTGVPAA